MTNQFAAFAGFEYYPSPGWTAFLGAFTTLDEAISTAKEAEKEVYDNVGWWQVVDLLKLEVVAGEGSGHTGLYGSFPANP